MPQLKELVSVTDSDGDELIFLRRLGGRVAFIAVVRSGSHALQVFLTQEDIISLAKALGEETL